MEYPLMPTDEREGFGPWRGVPGYATMLCERWAKEKSTMWCHAPDFSAIKLIEGTQVEQCCYATGHFRYQTACNERYMLFSVPAKEPYDPLDPFDNYRFDLTLDFERCRLCNKSKRTLMEAIALQAEQKLLKIEQQARRYADIVQRMRECDA